MDTFSIQDENAEESDNYHKKIIRKINHIGEGSELNKSFEEKKL